MVVILQQLIQQLLSSNTWTHVAGSKRINNSKALCRWSGICIIKYNSFGLDNVPSGSNYLGDEDESTR